MAHGCHRFSIAASWLAALTMMIGPVGCSPSSAGEHRQPVSQAGARVVAGELIIKLKPPAGEVLDQALDLKRSATQTGLAWLDTLNAQYGVTTIELIFPHQPGVESIQRTFPQRARRTPPNTQPPTLRYIYKFTLSPSVDLVRAAAAYAGHPDVVYAQSNYLATTQHTPSSAP